ncbi:carboxypeptidase-like regulatory domain-containing protein [Chitinophaga horti]|uniref:Carboxypeptidase-like regulatory domain-containing protein n=1 Tax=Chitinophaga horti TaxID=2920382 RepID=A0ABY6J4Z3_9BACT|nr:carboxypeptidase-like regulatory domain-containing protein [Chitinophaga horti]UYQ93249.1 carboxypeptidase-like regulatory domain-containing protein [Chitinophaga horti]
MRRITIVLQFIIVFVLGAITQASAQSNGKVSGKVTDRKSGESLIGVTVIVQGTSTGAVTDVEGRYNISVKPGTYTLQVKFMGYATKEISEVVVKAGGVTNLDLTMDEPKSEKLNEVVIRGSARTETLNSLLTFQKNTNTVAQVVSAETIRKSPDRNTSDVLKRVPGASMIDGKYIVVRGLSDRYNQTMMNGALMSSTEPDRKTFSFDLFPSSIIDNIIINKAATPEMPAEFAGGLVQINTKDVPDQNFFNISVGSGFNTNVLGKDFYSYKGGKFDFFGVDDGDRKLPGIIPSADELRRSSPAQRAEMAQALNDKWSVSDESGN